MIGLEYILQTYFIFTHKRPTAFELNGEKDMLTNNELVLFHGTNTVFDKIDLKKSKDK